MGDDVKDNRLDDLKVASAFVNDMAVAVCVSRADDYRILYANDYLINLAGCSDYDDFMDYTGGIFDGLVDEAQIEVLHKDFHIETQSLHNSTGYAFYNTRKKSGKLIRVVNHWTLYQDPEEGVLVFATIYPHKYENTSTDYDAVTALYTRQKFKKHLESTSYSDRADATKEYAIVYVNLVNFKSINNNTTHWRIVETYGQEFANKVLHCMADTIVKTAGRGAAVSRTKEAVFVVMCRIKDRDGFISLAEKIKKALSAIIEVEGNRVTMRIKFSAKIRSEESTYDEAIYELALKDVM